MGDHAAGDRADLGRDEHVADLGGTDDFLALLRRQHARHRGLQLVHRVVDDVVVVDVDAVALGQLARRRRRVLKPIMTALDAIARLTSIR